VTSRDVHSESCRAVRFLPDGSGLVSAGVDCTLVVTNVETGARIARVAEAHDAAINRLCMLTETLLATGARRRRRRRGAAAARAIHACGGCGATAAQLTRFAPRGPPQATMRVTCGFGTRARARAWARSACTRTLSRTCTTARRATRCSPPAATARWRCWTCVPRRSPRAPTTRRMSCFQVRSASGASQVCCFSGPQPAGPTMIPRVCDAPARGSGRNICLNF